MKTRLFMLALFASCLISCDTPAGGDSSSYYYPSANRPASSPGSTTQSIASMAGSSSAPVPRGGYAPGSGSTAIPQGNQFMYQQNVSGPFGSRSTSGVINAYGGVQSYQTIGGMPVYPGMAFPGYNHNQPSYRTQPSLPVFVPGVGGTPGYYINPNTGARVRSP